MMPRSRSRRGIRTDRLPIVAHSPSATDIATDQRILEHALAVLGSTAAAQARASALVSLRMPPGMGAAAERQALVASVDFSEVERLASAQARFLERHVSAADSAGR